MLFLSAPWHFVRSGYAYLPGRNGGTFLDAGLAGDWWSSSGNAATDAYNLSFGAASGNSSNGPINRWYGISLRCLSAVLDI